MENSPTVDCSMNISSACSSSTRLLESLAAAATDSLYRNNSSIINTEQMTITNLSYNDRFLHEPGWVSVPLFFLPATVPKEDLLEKRHRFLQTTQFSTHPTNSVLINELQETQSTDTNQWPGFILSSQHWTPEGERTGPFMPALQCQ